MQTNIRKRSQVLILVVICAVALLQRPDVRASGPLSVGSGTFGGDGVAFVWPSPNLTYTTDGPAALLALGVLSKAQADTRIANQLAKWTNLTTSTVAFAQTAGTIAADGDVNTVAEFDAIDPNAGGSCAGNPVIYDVDGSLTTNALGADPNSLLGFAGGCTLNSSGQITSGWAFFNGNVVTASAFDLAQFDATVLHEFGHFAGLGHTQVNNNCAGSGFCANGSDDSFGWPTMMPISFGLEENVANEPSELTLAEDDIAGMSKLYPDMIPFNATFATISGTVFFSDGTTHVQGVNVIARQVNDAVTPQDESRRCVFSSVSGYRFTENIGQTTTGDNDGGDSFGSRTRAFLGTYDIVVRAVAGGECTGSTVGQYTLSVESIDSRYVGGSSVGPLTDAQIPLPGAPPAPGSAVVVGAGGTSGGNNFTLVGTAPTRDAFEGASSNDAIANATPLGNGTITASISPLGAAAPDIDVYAFTALANTTITFEIFARRAPHNDFLDPVVEIVDGSGTRVATNCDSNFFNPFPTIDPYDGVFNDPCINDDINLAQNRPSGERDSRLFFRHPTGGTFFLRVLDWRGQARPDFLYDLSVSGAGQAPLSAGCTKEFDNGGGDGQWNTATNWNPDGVPGAADDVCIGAAFNVGYPSGTTTVNSLSNIAGTLNINGGDLTVTSSTAVGGTLNSTAGFLRLGPSNIANLTMNSGTVIFNGPTANILALTFNSGDVSAVGGTVNLPAAGYTQNGALSLLGGSVTTAGTITLAGGVGLIEGGTPGTLTANINQTGGAIAPGEDLAPGIGILNVTGNFTQSAGGVVAIEIVGNGGPGAANGHDQLNVSGTAMVDGTFRIVQFGGFTPNIGDSFTIATCGSVNCGSGNTQLDFSMFPLPADRMFVEAGPPTNDQLVIQVVAAGTTFTFDNEGGDSEWTNTLNWSPDGMPTTNDTVVIGGTFAVTINGTAAAKDCTINTTQPMTLATGTFTVSGLCSIATGGFTHTGGTLDGPGTISVSGPMTWSGGTQMGAGTTSANGGMTLDGSVTLSRTLNLDGTNTWSSGTLSAVGSPMVTLANGATFAVNISDGSTFGAIFTNNGMVTRSAGVSQADFNVFNNSATGSVNVTTEVLNMNNGGTSTGSFTVTSPGDLRFSGTHNLNAGSSVTGDGTVRFLGVGTANIAGTYNVTGTTQVGGPASVVNFNATATTNVLNQTGGTLGGTGTLTATGLFTWVGGTQTGSGTTIANSGLNITGSVQLNGRTLNNTGAGVMSGAGSMPAGNGSVFNNSGTFDLQNNGALGGGIGGAETINNSGTLMKSGGGGTNNIGASALAFTNTGTININNGSLTFNNVSGSVTQSGASSLTRLNGGNLSSSPGVTFTFNGGTLDAVGGSTITGNVVVNSGAMVNPGLSPGTLNIMGDYVQGAGGTLNIEVGGTAAGQFDVLAISGTATLDGTLNVLSFGGFMPTGGPFQIMTFGSRVGDFDPAKIINNANPGATMTTTPGTNDYVINFQAAASADLSVTIADAPDPVNIGQTLTYTVTASNAGPDDAATVTLTDTLPSNVAFVSASGTGWTCNEAGGVVTCTRTSITASTSAPDVTIMVTVQAAAANSVITNSASVASASADPDNGNNADTEDTTVNPAADLSIAKTDSPDPVSVNGNVTYTLSVSNAGPSDATNVSVTDTLPAGVAFVSASGTGWTCGQAGGVVTCTRASLTVSTAPDITITVTAPGTPGQISNTASVTADEFDSNAGNNTDTEMTNVTGVADLAISKADSPDPVDAAATLTYTLSVSNGGPSDATNVSVTDTLPAGVAFVSATGTGWTCNQAAGVVTCTRATLAASTTAPDITITVTAPDEGGMITNSASVSADEFDSNAGDNSDTEDTTVTAQADLSVTKTDSPDPVSTGATLTYTVSVSSAGPSTASAVTVTDTLPAGVTFMSATGTGWTCNEAGGVVTCTRASQALGAAPNIMITVTAPGAPGMITNSVTVAASTADAVAGNNTATADTTVNPTADMSVTKTDVTDPVNVLDNVTYTITVMNGGPNPATNASLNDTLPASTTFVSLASPAGWTCTTPAVGATGTVNCTNPTLANGASNVFTLVVATTAASAPSISDTATVTATEADSNAGNNSATQTTTVNPLIDLTMTKTDSPDPVIAGNNLTYTLAVSNAGPSDATGVSVTDTLPAGVTFVSATGTGWTCNQAAGVVTCTRATLAVGAAPAITVVVTVNPATAAGTVLSNTASVTATETDTNAADNSDTETTTVNASADLAIVKSDSPDPVVINNNVTYTVTVTNNGPSSATNVSVTDTLPAGVTFVSASGTGWTCNQAAGVVTCTVASLASGAAPAITIVVTAPGAAGTLTNTASVTATPADPNAANNSASADTTVNAVTADFSLSVDPPSVAVPAGLPAFFNVTATSLGGFAGTVNFTCSGNPELSTCTVDPASVTLASGGMGVAQVIITTKAGSNGFTAGNVAPPPLYFDWRVLLPGALLVLTLSLLMFMPGARRHGRPRMALQLASVVLLCVFAFGCADGGKSTPAGTYTITITGTSGTTTRTTTATLVVR